ncbi:hypothetical protein AJ80_03825 [Polytolypa hystricis UAMH7299]|uniref:AT hook domain-containing protein n=1 Tax=Polytolypa hystricis (strain UAMH7299) TaxID=1447883 RepID=A0A2B7YEP9_POLH7|nr:hypothetical protein AJ80_03825 [Polytolypa hystricis UAMH7299]
MTIASNDAPPVRKRGRPRKYPIDAEKPAKPTAPDGTPRKRGRPRKNPEVEPAATKPAAAPTTTTTGVKRGRGRPRKTNAPPAKKPRLMEDGTPRKRGRPRKSDAGAVGSASKASPQTSDVNGSAKKSSASVFPLAKIVGTYALTCDAVEENWPDQADDMELTISSEPSKTALGFIGGFNLGVLEGTMLLAGNEDTLEKLREEMSADEGSSSGLNGKADSEISSSSDDGKAEKPTTRNDTSSTSRRVYFHWRGRETSEGEIHSNNSGQDGKGYLDFTSDSAVAFEGVSSFPVVGEKIVFRGKKTDNKPTSSPEPWADFSESAAKEASAGRWG